MSQKRNIALNIFNYSLTCRKQEDTRLARILKARLQTCLIKGSLKAQNQRKDGGKYGGKLVYEFIASVYGQ